MDYTEFISEAVDWIITIGLRNIVLFAIPLVSYLLFVRQNNSTELELGCYSIPGRFYHFKRLWALFRLQRLRHCCKRKEVNKNYTYGLIPSPEEVQVEESKILNNRYGVDCTFIFGVDNEGNMLIMRMATERLKHRLHPEVWIHAYIRGEVFQFPMHPDSGLPSTGPASIAPSSMGKSYNQVAGLKFEVCEPMRKWRIHFNGLLRKGCHKEMTFENQELVHVKFNFIWTACSNPFYVHKDYSLSLASEALAREPWRSGDWINAMKNYEKGYDQWGTLYGEWRVGEPVINPTVLHLRGIRRRRWGPPCNNNNDDDDSINLRHKAEILGVSRQGSFFSVGAFSMDVGGLTHACFGHYRSPAGVVSPIDSCDISLPNLAHFGNIRQNFVVRFSANGKSYTADVRLIPFGDAVLYTGRPWKYKSLIACIDFGLNSGGGFGISEFRYRYDGPCPISTQESMLVPQHLTKLSVHLGETLTKQEKEQLEESKPLFLLFDDPLCQNSKIVGGKGSSLAVTASMAGAPVPNGFCLTIFAFRLQVNSNQNMQDAIYSVQNASLKGMEQKELQVICKRAVEVISKTPVCSAVVDAVIKGMETLKITEGIDDKFGFAVRSSAIGEDSQDLSSAGQNATVLGCKGNEKIVEALTTCWASLYAFPSVHYRRQHGQIINGADIAVVIQKMVPADLAGVMFTRHPYTGNPSHLVITANYGLGESVVAAIAEPDTITLSRSWEDTLYLLESKIGEKSVMVSVDEENGCTKEERVDEKLLQKLCLTTEQALSLGQIGLLLESVFCSPRDIEWAIVKDDIYILQARPITALDSWTDFELLHELDSPVVTDSDVSTVANTGEVLPGFTTPLTSSVMSKALELIIQKSPARGEIAIPHYLKNAVISHHQLAMNVINTFFKINGKRISLEDKVVYLAVFGHPNIPPELHRLGVERHGIMGFFDKGGLTLSLAWQALWASSVTKKAILRSKELDLHPENFKLAKELYQEISANQYNLLDFALDHNYASTIGVFSQSILLNVLTERNEDLTADHYADISLLLSSCSNVVSAEIPKDLKVLASKISKSDGANEFCDAPVSEAASWFDNHPGEASDFFKEFLSKHGHRCLREFDLYSKTWGMEPEILMMTLQIMVRTAGIGEEMLEAPVEGPEITVRRLKTPKKLGTRRTLKWLLPWCRNSVARREDTKSALVRTLHAFRLAYRHLGHLAQLEGIIPDQELLFYFTHYELGQLFNDDLSRTALLAKASRRRRLSSYWDNIQLPETFTGLAKPIVTPPMSDGEGSNEDEKGRKKMQVTGTSASIGIAVGRACVIKSLKDAGTIRPEDILITRSTDVGWSPYFPLLSGIATELGGLISHGAVVAREYGLPCIVGAASATNIFKTGDKVKLDAASGILMKIDTE